MQPKTGCRITERTPLTNCYNLRLRLFCLIYFLFYLLGIVGIWNCKFAAELFDQINVCVFFSWSAISPRYILVSVHTCFNILADVTVNYLLTLKSSGKHFLCPNLTIRTFSRIKSKLAFEIRTSFWNIPSMRDKISYMRERINGSSRDYHQRKAVNRFGK